MEVQIPMDLHGQHNRTITCQGIGGIRPRTGSGGRMRQGWGETPRAKPLERGGARKANRAFRLAPPAERERPERQTKRSAWLRQRNAKEKPSPFRRQSPSPMCDLRHRRKNHSIAEFGGSARGDFLGKRCYIDCARRLSQCTAEYSLDGPEYPPIPAVHLFLWGCLFSGAPREALSGERLDPLFHRSPSSGPQPNRRAALSEVRRASSEASTPRCAARWRPTSATWAGSQRLPR